MTKKELEAEVQRLRMENAILVNALSNMNRPVVPHIPHPDITPYQPMQPWNPNGPTYPPYYTYCSIKADGVATNAMANTVN